MANNYSRATLEPTDLYLTEDQRAYLAGTCAGFEDDSRPVSPLGQLADAANETPSAAPVQSYVYWEESFSEQPDADDIYEHLVDDWAGRGEGEWENVLREKCDLLAKMDFTDMLRDILLNPENNDVTSLNLQGSYSCSKMRPGEFGGFSCVVTREEYSWINTHQQKIVDGRIVIDPPVVKRFETQLSEVLRAMSNC